MSIICSDSTTPVEDASGKIASLIESISAKVKGIEHLKTAFNSELVLLEEKSRKITENTEEKILNYSSRLFKLEVCAP